MNCNCGKPAIWEYLPALKSENPYYCEECVSRECSCQINYTTKSEEAIENGFGEDPPEDGSRKWIWIDEGKSWCYVDNEGRKLPCIEYDPI